MVIKTERIITVGTPFTLVIRGYGIEKCLHSTETKNTCIIFCLSDRFPYHSDKNLAAHYLCQVRVLISLKLQVRNTVTYVDRTTLPLYTF